MEKNLVTVVTGGGRGIGRAISLRMAKETAVLVVGRTQSDLQSVCEKINNEGGLADLVVGDVADPATAQACLAKAVEKGWTVHNLVLNAATGNGGAITTFDQNVWKRMFDVNVHGAFYFIQACLPAMVVRKSGNICIISSIAGLKGIKYQSAYCATKHALVGLAESVALEYAKHGIVTVPICPGFVESEMTDRTIQGLMKHRGLTEAEARKLVQNQNPQKRILPAEEVADAVALVCSGQVRSLNGNPLLLTGGE